MRYLTYAKNYHRFGTKPQRDMQGIIIDIGTKPQRDILNMQGLILDIGTKPQRYILNIQRMITDCVREYQCTSPMSPLNNSTRSSSTNVGITNTIKTQVQIYFRNRPPTPGPPQSTSEKAQQSTVHRPIATDSSLPSTDLPSTEP